jgi:hypothetical protein
MPWTCLLVKEINWGMKHKTGRSSRHRSARFLGVRRLALDRTIQGLPPLCSCRLAGCSSLRRPALHHAASKLARDSGSPSVDGPHSKGGYALGLGKGPSPASLHIASSCAKTGANARGVPTKAPTVSRTPVPQENPRSCTGFTAGSSASSAQRSLGRLSGASRCQPRSYPMREYG